jgi:hypothetical protein
VQVRAHQVLGLVVGDADVAEQLGPQLVGVPCLAKLVGGRAELASFRQRLGLGRRLIRRGGVGGGGSCGERDEHECNPSTGHIPG